MRFTSASIATSPTTARASPPARLTRSTVSAAAWPFRSATTIRAPSRANRTAASRPMPMPAPVMSATFFSSRPAISPVLPPLPSGERAGVRGGLDSLEVADELPVGDRLVVGLLLEAAVLEVVVHHLGPEGGPRDLRPLQLRERVAQRLRHLGQRRPLVGVALEHGRRGELLLYAVEPRRDGGREGEVRIGVRPRDAVLHPEAPALAADAEAAGAVVPAPCDAGRREGAGLVALVGVDGRRVEVGQLSRHRHLAAEPLLEDRGALARSALGGEQVAAAGLVPQRGVEMKRGARRAHVVLG